MPSPQQPRADLLDDAPPRVRWDLVFLLFTAAGALRFGRFYLDDLTRAIGGTFSHRLLEEFTAAYAALLLFPFLVAIERAYPLNIGRWRDNWRVHVLCYLIFSAAHTSLMWVIRSVLFPLLGHGTYDYGIMSVRYLMESSEDLISYSVLVGALTLMRVQLRLRNREVRAAALERDMAKARLEALSLRLQPHFLFNALNTISSTVYDDPAAADEMIGRLGDLLRHALRNSERQEVPVAEELETLRAYLTFVEARFGDRLRVDLDVDPSTVSLAVPAFLLQPLVENAVRHGASSERTESTIAISISRTDAALEIVIANDVSSRPERSEGPQDPPTRTGTGLGTTRDRLRLLYGDAATLVTVLDPTRFRVTIRIPARVLAPDAAPLPVPEHAGAHR